MSIEQSAGRQADFEEVRRRQAVERQREIRRERLNERGSPYGHPTGQTIDCGDLSMDKSKCQNCGRKLPSKDFGRVHGDNDDVAWGCPECYTYSAIKRGAAKSDDCDGAVGDGITTDPYGGRTQCRTYTGDSDV